MDTFSNYKLNNDELSFLGLALELLLNIFAPGGGARADAAHVGVLVTRHASASRDSATQAARCRLMGIHIMTIGVGPDVSRSELQAIASDASYVYTVTSWESLMEVQ